MATASGPPSTWPLRITTSAAFQGWTVTTNGPYSSQPYFLRLSKTGDPDTPVVYNLGNGSISADQRAVVDDGFLELARFGEIPATAPVISELAEGRRLGAGNGTRRAARATTGMGLGTKASTAPTSRSPAAPTATGTATRRTRCTAR